MLRRKKIAKIFYKRTNFPNSKWIVCERFRDHLVDEGVAFGLKRRPRRCVRRDVFINQPAYDNLILSLVVTITAERRFGGKGRKKAVRWASERSGASTQAALNSAPRRVNARGPLFFNERVSIKSIIRYTDLSLGCESIPFNYLRLHFAWSFHRRRVHLEDSRKRER